MVREKFKTLTEQMYYVLLALQSDRVMRVDIGLKLSENQKSIIGKRVLEIE
ncbi:MAG: hypothetical protein IKU69_01670 [Roseburia sp.]|nr:hypothetical protein [Roseburia sp.]